MASLLRPAKRESVRCFAGCQAIEFGADVGHAACKRHSPAGAVVFAQGRQARLLEGRVRDGGAGTGQVRHLFARGWLTARHGKRGADAETAIDCDAGAITVPLAGVGAICLERFCHAMGAAVLGGWMPGDPPALQREEGVGQGREGQKSDSHVKLQKQRLNTGRIAGMGTASGLAGPLMACQTPATCGDARGGAT